MAVIASCAWRHIQRISAAGCGGISLSRGHPESLSRTLLLFFSALWILSCYQGKNLNLQIASPGEQRMKVNWDHSCSTNFIYKYAKLVSLKFHGNYERQWQLQAKMLD